MLGGSLRLLRALVALGAVVGATLALAGPAGALSTGVVISQVFGGGGNASAPYQNDFVELFNRGAARSADRLVGPVRERDRHRDILLAAVAALSGVLRPGSTTSFRQAGAPHGVPLPTPDASGTAAMAAGAGKVIVANTATGLTCNGGSTPCSAAQLAQIVDLVGYDGANFFEGTRPRRRSRIRPPARARRRLHRDRQERRRLRSRLGVTAQYAHRGALLHDRRRAVGQLHDAGERRDRRRGGRERLAHLQRARQRDRLLVLDLVPAASGTHTAVASGGPTIFTLVPDSNFANGETCTVTVVAANVSDQDTADPPDTMAADYVFSFTTVARAADRHQPALRRRRQHRLALHRTTSSTLQPGDGPVSLSGWSVQYAAAAGTPGRSRTSAGLHQRRASTTSCRKGPGAGDGEQPPDRGGARHDRDGGGRRKGRAGQYDDRARG